jgi:hypothetical protein
MKAKVVMFITIIPLSILGVLALHLIEKYSFINMGGIKEITIAENVEFSEDWKEINLRKVEFPHKEYNSILIYSHLPAKRNGFEAPNEEVFYPEVMLEDHEGNKCSLKFMSRRTLDSLRFEGEEFDSTDEKCFSKPNTYKRLWIKSPVRFNAKKVNWEGYNLSDRK